MRQTLLLMLTGLLGSNICAAQRYDPADIVQWPERTFTQPTDYQLAERDGQTLLRADCGDGQAQCDPPSHHQAAFARDGRAVVLPDVGGLHCSGGTL